MATKILLAWNNDTQQYWAELEQGTLYVDGDAFAEERSDRVRTIIARAHPELDIDTISELISESVQGDEVDRADDNVFAELEDPTTWLSMAVELRPGQDLMDSSEPNADAWIVLKEG